MNTTPYRYQLEDVRLLHRKGGRGLVAWDMGLGKGTLSLWFAERSETWLTVVVCPAGLKWNWEGEAKTHFGLRAEVLDGTRPPKGNGHLGRLLVVNYDVLGPTRHGPGWLSRLRALRPGLVILDECQALADPLSIRTRACRELCRGVPHVLALSGTPLLNRPAELWPTLNILDPERFAAFLPFGLRYCGPRKGIRGLEFKGASNLGELHQLLEDTVLIRRRTEDVLPDLPPRRRIVRLLDVDLSEYHEAVHDFLGWAERNDPGKARGARKAQQITRLTALRQLVGRIKIPAVLDWLGQWLAESPHKILLFGVHRETVEALHQARPGESVLIHGGTPRGRRKDLVRKLLTSKGCRYLAGNIKAAGVGWSARGVPASAFAEFAWTPGEHLQAEKRTHGLGRGVEGTASTSWYLAAKGTIDEHLLAVIQAKQADIAAVLDGREGGENLDVFDLLENELRRGAKRGEYTHAR